MFVNEGENISLIKGDQPQSEVIVTKISADQNDIGGLFKKSKVVAETLPHSDISSFSERKIQLLIKQASVDTPNDCFGNEKLDMSPARRYYERWKYLVENDIPTVSSMRVVDNRRVAMGDMTRDGSAFFGKTKLRESTIQARLEQKRNLTQIEERYLNIDPNQIKSELTKIQQRCWENGVRLPLDDKFDLVVHPDGSWQILVLDLSMLGKRGNEKIEELEAEREEMFEKIDSLRNNLLKISNME